MAPPLDLIGEARRLTASLGGIWYGSSGMARCPAHNDARPSLSIAPGRTTILLHCFAGCAFVDVIRTIRSRGSLDRGCLPSGDRGRDIEVRDYAPLARRIWSEAWPLPGTLGERYLRGRRLFGPWTDLRFHPRTPVGAGRLLSYRPAVVAAVRDNGGLAAIHRIVLDPSTAGKATDLDNPKLTLGRPRRGAVRLFKAARTLGLAEGIETAKSAARRLQIPVWATLGSERFPLVDIPFDVTRLVLLPDRGPAGERGVALAEQAYWQPGRTIEPILPFGGFDDWNELDLSEARR